MICFFVDHRGTAYMLAAYGKNSKETLTADDLKTMRKLTKELKNEN